MTEDTFLNFLNVMLILLPSILTFCILWQYKPPPWFRKWNSDTAANNDENESEKTHDINKIPGPLALPLIGTGWLTYTGHCTMNKLHEFYIDMHKKYGAIMKEEAFMNVPVVHVFDKSDIEKVLRCNSKYPLRPPQEAMVQYRKSRPDRYSTTGIVNEQGEAWQFLRSTLCPVLTSPRTVSEFATHQTEAILDDWCSFLRTSRNSQNQIENFEKTADHLVLEITCAFILGRRMGFLLPGTESAAARQLAKAVHTHFLSTRDTYFGLPLWRFFPTSAYRKLVESEETIYRLAVDLIKTTDQDCIENSPVLEAVLHSHLDEKEKIAALVDFIAASINTMKNTFRLLLHSIASDSKIQENILTSEDSSYLKACLTESFRLYPTAFFLARILDTDMTLSGYNLKSGDVVVCHTGIACRQESNFQEPLRFKPERWLQNDEHNETSNSLLAPFGAGRRICPAKRFMEQIVPILVEHTVKKFVVTCDRPLELQFEFLLSPKGPMTMYFEDRL